MRSGVFNTASYKLDGKTLTITQEPRPDRASSESDNLEADANRMMYARSNVRLEPAAVKYPSIVIQGHRPV